MSWFSEMPFKKDSPKVAEHIWTTCERAQLKKAAARQMVLAIGPPAERHPEVQAAPRASIQATAMRSLTGPSSQGPWQVACHGVGCPVGHLEIGDASGLA